MRKVNSRKSPLRFCRKSDAGWIRTMTVSMDALRQQISRNRITRNGNKYYVHIYENTLGPLPLIGFDKNKIVKVRALDDGHEVPISTLWVHSDYPDIAFVDLGPDPVLPDPVDYVLEVEMAE